MTSDRETSSSASTEAPAASVVIAVLDAAEWLSDQLEALSRQVCRDPWEIIVADNGSTDGSLEIARDWADEHPSFGVVEANNERGIAFARNAGAAHSHARNLLFCDADDVVGPNWVASHIEALQQADASYGPVRGFRAARQHWDFSGDWDLRSFRMIEPMVHLPGCNMAMRRSTFDDVGGFATDIAGFGAEDVDISIRIQTTGHSVSVAPEAKIYRRKAETARQEFRKKRLYSKMRWPLIRRYGDRLIDDSLRLPWRRGIWWLLTPLR